MSSMSPEEEVACKLENPGGTRSNMKDVDNPVSIDPLESL